MTSSPVKLGKPNHTQAVGCSRKALVVNDESVLGDTGFVTGDNRADFR